MRIPFLRVEIDRSERTRNLSARGVQQGADGEHRGQNILARTSIRRIESAKRRATEQFIGVDTLEFDVKASPDWKRPERVVTE